ncbi:hypothetical protein A4A49_33124 [Nicotiana attenuata]|uniref:Plant basic secretory protein (BSP) family protein n=2 Tax=Nicotiana attenuata TaxID=49451 RepID=A0A1J6KJ01_NICAT|nr:hypothetical protein A4A49_33124 [Nicotiana attenuata]
MTMTYFLNSLLFLAIINGIHAVNYSVTITTASGTRFDRDIGGQYTLQTLDSATNFICNDILKINCPINRKDVQHITIFVADDMDGDDVAYQDNNEIHVNSRYIEGYSGDVKREITGVLYHEMTHVWQWKGNGQAPQGLIEGVADYVRLKAGFAPSHWVKSGQGSTWDQGYDVTARFLDYCNSLKDGFVVELNKKMRDAYSHSYFCDLLGKSVDQLWEDYKATFTY